MKMLSKSQLYVILGAFLLIVLLYIAPKQLSKEETTVPVPNEEGHVHSAPDLNLIEDSVANSLRGEDSQRYNALKKAIENSQNEVSFDSIITFWKNKQQPLMAGKYAYQLAEKTNSAKNWAEAGKHYYIASNFSPAELKNTLLEKTIVCYTKANELEPTNLAYKTSLGVCYVEGTSDPMKGITLLREVLQTDSTYVEAHVKLGLFAVKSQQFEKAIERFEKVIKLKPDYLEAYLYLGETFASVNKNKEAIEILEKFKKLSTDGLINAEVDKFINELKNKK